MLNRTPTKQELLAAAGKTLPDVIAKGLRALFCGINPGLYSAAVGHHFARPGNRFWPTLYRAGFTDRLLAPFEENQLLDLGYGITNLVARSTPSAAELPNEGFFPAAGILEKKVFSNQHQFLQFSGLAAYPPPFGRL